MTTVSFPYGKGQITYDFAKEILGTDRPSVVAIPDGVSVMVVDH